MTVQEGVVTRLSASAGLTVYVANRIWPFLRPNPALPAVTYGLVSAVPHNSIDGFSTSTRFRVQVDIWSLEYSQAQGIALQVRNAVIGSNQENFSAIYVDAREFYESDVKLWNLQIDFSIHFTE